MLIFTERLKELIFDIEMTGGSSVQTLSISLDLRPGSATRSLRYQAMTRGA